MAFEAMRYMNPYEIHKALINEYILKKPGDTRFLKRDTSKDKTDFDVLKENHKFLWDGEEPKTWEERFAKKYYDKLFKEYCIGDLSRYKENKVALRWRTEQEVIVGKGQFSCGNKKCQVKEDLRTWEVNFAYVENEEKKNALVKIRLCVECSKLLNYHSKKREVKRLKKKVKDKAKSESMSEDKEKNKTKNKSRITESKINEVGTSESLDKVTTENVVEKESPWANLNPPDLKSRDEEMDEYLEELLL